MPDRPTATGYAILDETQHIQERLASLEQRMLHCETLLEQIAAEQPRDRDKLESIVTLLRQIDSDIHITSRAAVELAAGTTELHKL